LKLLTARGLSMISAAGKLFPSAAAGSPRINLFAMAPTRGILTMKPSRSTCLPGIKGYISARPLRMAYITRPTLDFTFNFSNRLLRYSSTVRGLTYIFAAISL
jgi:hypothetical protein